MQIAEEKSKAPEPLWTDRDLAEAAKISPRTLAQWRYTGKFKAELPFIKIGRCVRFQPEVARAFLAKGILSGGAE